MEQAAVTVSCADLSLRIAVRCRETRGDTILCIHGLGCAKEHFDEIFSFHALDGYSLLAPDLPGFGDSPAPDGFSCDLNDYALVCMSLLSCCHAGRVHILGHSMGGAVGLLLAEMMGERVGSFINVEGNLIGQDCVTSRRQASISFEEFTKERLPAMIMITSLSGEKGQRIWSRTMDLSNRRAMYQSSKSLTEWSDSGSLLHRFISLRCRKIYIYGERNAFVPVLSRLKGISAVSISNSGHFPMNDNPREFCSVVADFLKGA